MSHDRRRRGVSAGLSLGEARPAHAGPRGWQLATDQPGSPGIQLVLSGAFPAPRCPASGRRHQGVPPGRRRRASASRTFDSQPAHTWSAGRGERRPRAAQVSRSAALLRAGRRPSA